MVRFATLGRANVIVAPALVAMAAIVGRAVFPVLIPRLELLGGVDAPVERSSHTVPTPRGAGLGVLAISLGLALGATTVGAQVELTLLLAAVAIGIAGAIEDFFGLPLIVRLFAQLLGGLATVTLVGFADVYGMFLVGVVSIAVAYWINVVNFMDGINGITISASVVILCVHAGLLVADGSDHHEQPVVFAALCGGSLLSFLPYNFPVARAFLGDSGSYFAGSVTSISALSVYLAGQDISLILAPMLPYVVDSVATLAIRSSRREAIWRPHREHSYQLLANELELGHAKTTGLYTVITALCVLIAYLAGIWGLGQPTAIGLSLLVALLYAVLPRFFVTSRMTEGLCA